MAPGRLELVRRFVNTRDFWKRVDWIDSPERLSAWLVEQRLVTKPPRLKDEDVARARAFREALRAMLLAHSVRPESPEAVATFNEIASSVPLVAEATPDGIWLDSTGQGQDALLGSIVVAVVAGQLEGTWPRLKACANERCLTGMYDRTKNQTRVWCDASTCGAQMRARSYRQRRRERANEQS